MDFSRHMNQVLEVNVEEQWARVQPGARAGRAEPPRPPDGPAVRPRHLDLEPRHARRHDGQQLRRLALDRLRAHRRSRHRDHARCWPTAPRVVFGEVTPAEFEAKCRVPGLEGDDLPRGGAASATQYADEIRARYPRHWRRVAGYNLNELVGIGVRPHSYAGGGNGRPRPFSMARLVVGSEGTLADHPRGQGAADAAAQGHRAGCHPLPRHPGGARVVAVDPGDRALRGGAHRQDDPRPRPRTTSSSRRAMGFDPGRSGRHHDRRVRGRDRGRGARQGRGAGGAPPARAVRLHRARGLRCRPSSAPSGSCARRGSGCCWA